MATYHIDINHGSASNSNAGTSESLPWLNLQSINTRTFSPNDLILAKAGTYAEPALVNIGSPRGEGTLGNPITLRAYPGHEGGVIITRPGTPTGKSNISVLRLNADYWRIQGLTFKRRVECGFATGQEISFNLFDGNEYPIELVDGTVIRSGLKHEGSFDTWIHHNEFKNWVSSVGGSGAPNHGAMIIWTQGGSGPRGSDYLIEDNYIHDCVCGIYEKAGGLRNIYRRNYIRNIASPTGQTVYPFQGNNQGDLALYDVYNNVIYGTVNIFTKTNGARFFNNYHVGSRYVRSVGGDNDLTNLEIYSNVMIPLQGSSNSWSSLVAYYAGLFSYYDNNVYSGTPTYGFASVDQPLSFMTSRGYELDIATGVALSSVYTSGWALKAPYTTAGRSNGPVGPVDGLGASIVALILNTSRYGPSAFDPGAPSNQPPTASLSITNITNLTVDTDNTGSVDPDGTIASRSTNWGDGSAPSTGTAPSHTYAAAGVYNITLTVTDDEGATDQDTEQVQLAGATLHLSLASVRPSTRRRGVRI